MKIRYSSCIVCGNENLIKKMMVQDYTVSHEIFEIWECENCTFRFTQDVHDSSEIGKYYKSDNYISHSDTKLGLINSLYHKVRSKTLRQKRKLIERTTQKNNRKLLDIGAGTGAFLNEMKTNGWNTIGLEPDPTARENASHLYNINLMDPAHLFSLPEGEFDAITMWHVLEHVHTLNEYISHLKILLDSKGAIFIAVPNYTSYDALHYKEFWAAYDVPRHLYHFSPSSMNRLITKHGMKIEKIIPMWFDSFYVSMLSEQYKNNNNNYFKAGLIGSLSNINAFFKNEKASSLIYVITRI